MTSINFEKIDDVFQCKLKLINNTEFIIPMREDGYIYATELCKAAGKEIKQWIRLKETKKLIDTLKSKGADSHLTFVEVYIGSTKYKHKYKKGTWIHPELGIHLAQWCSPEFTIQVSKWIRELIITKKVEVGKEKENLEEEYKKIVEDLKQKVVEKDKELEEKNKELKAGEQVYNHLQILHQKNLEKRERYKFKKGPCIYIASSINQSEMGLKIGYSGNLSERNFTYATATMNIIYICYAQDAGLMEDNILLKYKKNRELNREWIINVSKDELINSIHEIAKNLNIEYNEIFEVDKEFGHLMNKVKRENAINILISDSKKCPSCEKEKNKTEFGKDKVRPDGLSSYCKECKIKNHQEYREKNKEKDTIELTKKRCVKCKDLKSVDNFVVKNDAFDKLQPWCNTCINNYKKERAEKKKKENISYKCPYCEKIYNLKDSVRRHVNKDHEDKKNIKLDYKKLETDIIEIEI